MKQFTDKDIIVDVDKAKEENKNIEMIENSSIT